MVLVYLIYSYFQLRSVWGTTDWQPRAAFQGKTCLFHWWFQVPLLLWLRCYWQISWEGSQQFTTILGLPSGHFTQHHTTIWYGWPLYRWFPPETKRGDGTKGRLQEVSLESVFPWFPIWFPIWFPMVSQYGRGFNRSTGRRRIQTWDQLQLSHHILASKQTSASKKGWLLDIPGF